MTYKVEYAPLSKRQEFVAKQIVDAAFQVHVRFGPGLLEKVYEVCLCHELQKRGLKVERQVSIPIVYDGIVLDEGFKADILVDNLVIVELKAVSEMHPVYEAQLLSYMKLMNKRLGFLINFHVVKIKDGIRRFVI